MISPPAARMRALAVAVKRSAAMVSFGTTFRRMSSVTVATMTMVLPVRSAALVSVTIFERETGGRLIFDRKRRRRMVWMST
jgi:hypothetical protein